MERQIAGGPESCSLLQSAVAEESHHDLARAGDPEDLPERQRLSGICSFRRIHNFRSVFIYGSTGRRSRGGAGNIPGPPKRKAEKQDSCQGHLQDADIPVAGVPGGAAGKYSSHDIWPCGGSDTPHAVKPAHVAAGIVESNVVVQSSVHASGTKSIGNSPQT